MSETGFVTLVGAGPGDPGLMTLAGRRALENAEVVLYDRLVGKGVLAMIPPDAETVDVGKNKGHHPTPQMEINRLLLDYALKGKRVVRLKGGDPYLFGRGAEELELLQESGIPFRVVPGITSAIAVPAYAGIPVTHREYSSSLHIVTGHGKNGEAPKIAWNELVGLKGTLVFLMGLSSLADIRAGLLEAGMPPETPAALIENGTRPEQRRLIASLASIIERAGEEGFSPPAVLVVGKVCELAPRFDWLSRLPLAGKKILTVSTRSTSGRLAAMLRDLGCAVDELPCLRLEPLPQDDALWETVAERQWIVLTSAFGAELFFDEAVRRGVDLRAFAGTRFAVVGPGTAEILRRRGICPDYMPDKYNGRALAEGLSSIVDAGDALPVLLYRARGASRELDGALRERGIPFEAFDAYETVKNPDGGDAEAMLRAAVAGEYDTVTFTSASAVSTFASAGSGLDLSSIPALCIGEATAGEGRRRGMTSEVAREATLRAMVDSILEKAKKTCH